MKDLKQGTNPTISFKTDFSAADVDVLHMVFLQEGEVLFRKEAEDVTWGDNYLAVVLSQEETYLFKEGLAYMRVRIKTPNGTAEYTDPYYFTVVKDEEGVVI